MRLQGLEELLAEDEDDGPEDQLLLEGMPADVRQERTYPSSLFPRIHCLRFQVLPSTHPMEREGDAPLAYAQVVEALQSALLGDRLAAEFAALMLISRPAINAAQQNEVESPNFGNLNLNLCLTDTDSTDAFTDIRILRLSALLRQMLPRSALMEVNINTLNEDTLFVAKNASGCGRTAQAPLQLGGGTALVLDESGMGEGVLEGCALKNIRALKGVLNDQKLLVECSYCDIQVPMDVSVITFSKAPSILSTTATIQLHLEPIGSVPMQQQEQEHEDSSAPDATPEPAHLPAMRQWWVACRSSAKPTMAPEVVDAAERDFVVAARGGHFTSSTLHRWILLAQLVALAHGSSCVTLDHWDKTQELEAQLLVRQSALAPDAANS
jgi:hypothetical protein